MKESDKVLKLMRFWMFGTFIIVFAAVTAYAGIFTGTKIFAEPGYWIIIGVAGVLCIGGYFGYQWWATRNAGK